MSGARVGWAVSGGGSLSATTTSTDDAGRARVAWTLGTTVGTDTVTVTVADLAAVTFTATGVAGHPASVQPSDHALALSGVGDTVRLAVSVFDRYENPIDSPPVEWSSSDTLVAHVDAEGLVTSRGQGTTTLTATSDTARATIDVTVSGVPETVVVHDGARQTGLAGEPLADSVAVKVTDASGAAVGGVSVTFAPRSGSGSVGPRSAVTNAAGVAATEWTLGASAGVDTVEATVAEVDGDPVVVTANATPNGTITGSLTLTADQQSRELAADLAAGSVSSPAGGRQGDLDRANRLPAATATRTIRGPGYMPGSLIVTYRSTALNAPPAGARAYTSMTTARAVANEVRAHLAPRASALGFDVRGVSPAILAARIRVEPGRLEAVRAALRNDRAVAAVEREGIAYTTGRRSARVLRTMAAPTVPNDPLYRPQMWHYNAIDIPAAWNHATGSREVVVAVVDDGIRFDHPSVAANLTDDGYDFVSTGEANVCAVPIDRTGDGDGYDPDPTIPAAYEQEPTCGLSVTGGHGLHVAGTIGAAGNDGIEMTGVNWSVSIRPVRVMDVTGTGSYYDIAQGILYAAGLPADDGAGGTAQAPGPADIINLSLGGAADSPILENAVQAATSAGALLVASAGNAATSAPSYPAAYAEALSVSAVGPDLQHASYSNYGATVDIAAPGGDLSDGGATFGVASTTWDFTGDVPSYAYYQGTSMAAPHVAGVAALILAHNPSLTADGLRARLLEYAVDLGPAGRDDHYGYGLVNARNSLTRTHAPTRELYARLYDADTGEILEMRPADPDGTYTFSELDDGSYLVFAGEDDGGDRLIGLPGRRWSAFGSGTATPSPVVVAGAGTYSASFSVGFPGESESTDAPSERDRLVVDSYVHGTVSGSDVDSYLITVPEGEYTFETSGWLGACWYAGEADTILELYDELQMLIASNNDIDASALNYCSRITRDLDAGTYELRVKHFSGGAKYRVQVRSGG